MLSATARGVGVVALLVFCVGISHARDICPRTDTNDHTLSHIVGEIEAASHFVGPDTGEGQQGNTDTWIVNVPSAPVDDTKLLMLHFSSVSLPGNNRIEVDLGYDTDVYTSASGVSFWSRPINIYPLNGAPVVVRYIADSVPNSGSASIDEVGVGMRHLGDNRPSFSNCDPFFDEAFYLIPKFDPFWYCEEPPNWENSACVGETSPGDIRAEIARSVGMILTPHSDVLSTCSVTLIDFDQVILAGHCFDADIEAVGSSVIFNYETDCAGNRLPGYAPRFYKVAQLLDRVWNGQIDYARLRLVGQPAGVPVRQLRPDLPPADEDVFGIHHPNGAVKVLGLPHAQGYMKVVDSTAARIRVPKTFHVSGGSSGSSLFDKAGRVLGVLSQGNPCNGNFLLQYYPSSSILDEISTPDPDPAPARDVMVVLDRSGSMSEDDISSRSKMDAAKDAASLFVQLIREDIGNRVGLVSFSSGATLEAGLATANSASKTNVIGASPYTGGELGSLIPSGTTAIGKGLEVARDELPSGPPGSNPRSILLMTDGMENVEPFISAVEPTLGGIGVWAVGFGTDANLDSAKLTDLAAAHNGLFSRATSGLALQKFFTQAFGNIFETGVLQDPEEVLPAGRAESAPMMFHICGEEALTVAAGWENENARLKIRLRTPTGVMVSDGGSGVETSTGRTWTFLRVQLPYLGESKGKWNVTVYRPRRSDPVPVPALERNFVGSRQTASPSLRYYINVIPTGGPTLRLLGDRRKFYTGKTINPRVLFRFADGSWPLEATVSLVMTRPNASIGAALSSSGLGSPGSAGGEPIPPRQATLGELGFKIGAVTESFSMSEESEDTDGLFEESGIYGAVLEDKLLFEGEYSFHVRAETAGVCVYSREVLWSVRVEPGVDPGRTRVTTTFTTTRPDGRAVGTFTVDPRDVYGNPIGPGRADILVFSPGPGTEVDGGVVDNGDGTYSVPIVWDPQGGVPPTVVVVQPGEPPIVLKDPHACWPPRSCCPTCGRGRGKKRCHRSAVCRSTPFGHVCMCRAGFRARGAVTDSKVQWRLKWPSTGRFKRIWAPVYRVFVPPGVACSVRCGKKRGKRWPFSYNFRKCREVPVRQCKKRMASH